MKKRKDEACGYFFLPYGFSNMHTYPMAMHVIRIYSHKAGYSFSIICLCLMPLYFPFSTRPPIIYTVSFNAKQVAQALPSGGIAHTPTGNTSSGTCLHPTTNNSANNHIMRTFLTYSSTRFFFFNSKSRPK